MVQVLTLSTLSGQCVSSQLIPSDLIYSLYLYWYILGARLVEFVQLHQLNVWHLFGRVCSSRGIRQQLLEMQLDILSDSFYVLFSIRLTGRWLCDALSLQVYIQTALSPS